MQLKFIKENRRIDHCMQSTGFEVSVPGFEFQFCHFLASDFGCVSFCKSQSPHL